MYLFKPFEHRLAKILEGLQFKSNLYFTLVEAHEIPYPIPSLFVLMTQSIKPTTRSDLTYPCILHMRHINTAILCELISAIQIYPSIITSTLPNRSISTPNLPRVRARKVFPNTRKPNKSFPPVL